MWSVFYPFISTSGLCVCLFAAGSAVFHDPGAFGKVCGGSGGDPGSTGGYVDAAVLTLFSYERSQEVSPTFSHLGASKPQLKIVFMRKSSRVREQTFCNKVDL